MHRIVHDIERAPRDLVEGFEGIPSAIISDVTGNVGLTMEAAIKPTYRGATMAGSALTVKAHPGDNLIIHKALTMGGPGDVLVIDGDGYVETAYLGELMATACQVRDMAGIVIDGAVRDREGIADLGFPVYARGVHPKGPYKRDPGSINVPITCGGVAVEPGDVVVGDDEGVAVVPPDDAEAVLEDAREKLDAEDEAEERIRDGELAFESRGYQRLIEELDVEEVGGP